jgi:hypothetical protein
MTAFDTVVLFDVENLLGAPTGWKKAAAKLSFRRHPDGDPQSVALVLKQVAVSGIQNEELSVVTDRVAAALSGTVGAADVKFTLLALAYNAVMSGQPPEAAVEERRYRWRPKATSRARSARRFSRPSARSSRFGSGPLTTTSSTGSWTAATDRSPAHLLRGRVSCRRHARTGRR